MIGTACSAVIVVGYLALRASPSVSLRARTTDTATVAAPTRSATSPTAPIAHPAGTSVPAAIAHAFQGPALPRALRERLAAGDVAGVAAALTNGTDATSTVNLFDLEALCQREGKGLPEAALGDEHAALEPAGLTPASRATVAALVAARHAWVDRFRVGCATATFDGATIRARLAATAASGDAASLERLGTTEARPLPRFTSAALLGNPRAAFRVALANFPAQARGARSWLEVAAQGDPDAEAYLGTCLLAGCAGPADPVAARLALESAARSGSLYALGLLASADAEGGARRWVRTDALIAPVALPRDVGTLELDTATEYAWAALAANLAEQGCFGFEFTPAAEALETRALIETRLRSAELAAAKGRADELAAETLAATRHALGCD